MQGEEQDLRICNCCGQKRSYPTQAGLWEYIQDPIFNPDGSLLTEFRGVETAIVNGQRVENHYSSSHEQVWHRVSIVDASQAQYKREDYSLLIVPVGKKRAIWWPDRALWRKVGDKPEIDWHEVIADGLRLGDGEWVADEEDDE